MLDVGGEVTEVGLRHAGPRCHDGDDGADRGPFHGDLNVCGAADEDGFGAVHSSALGADTLECLGLVPRPPGTVGRLGADPGRRPAEVIGGERHHRERGVLVHAADRLAAADVGERSFDDQRGGGDRRPVGFAGWGRTSPAATSRPWPPLLRTAATAVGGDMARTDVTYVSGVASVSTRLVVSTSRAQRHRRARYWLLRCRFVAGSVGLLRAGKRSRRSRSHSRNRAVHGTRDHRHHHALEQVDRLTGAERLSGAASDRPATRTAATARGGGTEAEAGVAAEDRVGTSGAADRRDRSRPPIGTAPGHPVRTPRPRPVLAAGVDSPGQPADGAGERGVGQRRVGQAEAAGVVSPGVVNPAGGVRPGVVSPGVVRPGAVRAGFVNPGAVNPGFVRPGAVSPGAVRPGAVKPGDLPGSGLVRPVRPGVVRADAAGAAGTGEKPGRQRRQIHPELRKPLGQRPDQFVGQICRQCGRHELAMLRSCVGRGGQVG